jgi:hypothetical protein
LIRFRISAHNLEIEKGDTRIYHWMNEFVNYAN